MNCACQSCGQKNCVEIVPIFSNLSAAEVREVASITRARTYEKSQAIYNAGDRKEKLFVVHTGKVKIYRLSPAGKEQVIRLVGPGQFFGELSLFSPQSATEYALALEDSSMCMIEGPRLKNLMGTHPSIGLKVMEELSRRLDRAESLIRDIALQSVEQRLARFLLDEAQDTSEVRLKTTKGNLASQLGMSQESLSRKLAGFQAKGLIVLKSTHIIGIADRARLETVVDGEDLPT
ncbi:MAG: Crp/Fnr family transcriptional regulator [Spirochaetota bacterium]